MTLREYAVKIMNILKLRYDRDRSDQEIGIYARDGLIPALVPEFLDDASNFSQSPEMFICITTRSFGQQYQFLLPTIDKGDVRTNWLFKRLGPINEHDVGSWTRELDKYVKYAELYAIAEADLVGEGGVDILDI